MEAEQRRAVGFAAGTRVATPAGAQRVEMLNIGDLVDTLHGGPRAIKWIGRCERADAVRIEADALDDGMPTRPLFVLPDHGICIDGGIVAAARLVNGVSITRAALPEARRFYQLDLDEHDILLAEDCPAESLADAQTRRGFDNAAQYAALYPAAPPFPATPCLPALDEGFPLQAVLAHLNERAGIAPEAVPHGALLGFIDEAGPRIVAGWAQNEADSQAPVCLDIFVAGVKTLRTLANRYRPDLEEAAIGAGNHSFRVELTEAAQGPIEVRRTSDQAPLPRAAGG
jgi:hypothetical protein